MNIIIYALLIILIILVFILIFITVDIRKNKFNDNFKYELINNTNSIIKDENYKISSNIISELNGFKDGIKNSVNKDIDNLVLKVEEKLKESNMLDKKAIQTLSEFKENILNGINQNLNNGFEKTEKTFKEVLSRLTVVDEAQKNIINLSEKIESFKEIFKDKKARGSFGEIILEQVLDRVYGDSGIFERQYKLKNNKIVDAVIYINNKENILCVDSKFPLENYSKYLNDVSDSNRKNFISDIKKHIDDISSKYIIEGETLNIALMFIPSESIYMDIYSDFYEDILNYAYSKKVWIVSPKSLMLYITTLKLTTLNYKKNKNAELILKNLNDFSEEFIRFNKRWEKLKSDFVKLENDFSDIDKTSTKILNKFNNISNMVEMEK